MRLAIITANPLALNVFFVEQTRGFRDAGIDVHTICAESPELVRFCESTGSVLHAAPLQRSPNPFADFAAVFHVYRILRRIKPDIVHAHMPKAGLLGLLAAWAARVPVRFFTIHGIRAEGARGLGKTLLRRFETLTCTLATQVLAVSHFVRQAAIENGYCSAEKIAVLRDGSCSGVNTAIFDPARVDAQAARERLHVPPDARLICYAGRIARDKGIGDLAEMWKRLRNDDPNLWLLLCGARDPEDPIGAATEAVLDTDPHVVQTRRLEPNMAEVMAGIDLCVLPTHREGLGMVALEASAMCRPVVAYRTGGVAEAVVDGVTGLLVRSGDRTALEAAVRKLLASAETCLDLGRAGRRYVQERFESTSMTAALVAAYRGAVK